MDTNPLTEALSSQPHGNPKISQRSHLQILSCLVWGFSIAFGRTDVQSPNRQSGGRAPGWPSSQAERVVTDGPSGSRWRPIPTGQRVPPPAAVCSRVGLSHRRCVAPQPLFVLPQLTGRGEARPLETALWQGSLRPRKCPCLLFSGGCTTHALQTPLAWDGAWLAQAPGELAG